MKTFITIFAFLIVSTYLVANEKIEVPAKGFYSLDQGDEWLNTKHYNKSSDCTLDMYSDKAVAKDHYVKSCSAGNAKGCYNLAFVYDILGFKFKAKENYIKACDLGYMSGCKQNRILENNGIYLHQQTEQK